MGIEKNIGFKSKFSDFLLWSGLIISIIALILAFAVILIEYKPIPPATLNPHDLWTPDSAWVGIWTMISTFTIQSNFLVFLFFCFVLTNRFYENRAQFVFGRFSLAITVYISVTLIVFFAILFKPMLNELDPSDSISILNFINTFLLHLIVPVIVILYFMFSSGKYYWKFGKQTYLWIPIISIYMFVYLAYALLKGNFVGHLKRGAKEIDYSFPYPFLNFHKDLGTFFIYIAAILVLYIILMLLFTFYNNMLYKKNNKPITILKDTNF
ncbi:hypothetical protein [Spiroplasma endosymbiont of Polydrusus pterygomalis]|uniref:hypothetical protein n=1 Tax=Spiroplasma endosymbiont of Polydrusus pterygomalis TaxID=3139327 RepID=UPI003CCABAB5